jgi:hypothetical protein
VRAISNGEDFKAVIVLPVHPDGPLRANREPSRARREWLLQKLTVRAAAQAAR